VCGGESVSQGALRLFPAARASGGPAAVVPLPLLDRSLRAALERISKQTPRSPEKLKRARDRGRVSGMKNLVLPALFALGLLACGGAEAPPQVPSQPTATAAPKADNAEAAAEARTAPQPTSTIRRASIRGVLQAGPGAFLQRVTLDDHAVFQGGKFHGFRVQHLNDAELFRGVDLKPGDVITSINGFGIEHPEEALEAFKSLEVASELKVGYERDGVPRELRYAIVDDEPFPPPAAPPAKSAPAAPAKR
jgi:hypothetical protein